MKLEDYKKLIKAKTCRWCKASLENKPIEHYPHISGWEVEGFDKLQWLYITCDCGYQWALWKLGVPRNAKARVSETEKSM